MALRRRAQRRALQRREQQRTMRAKAALVLRKLDTVATEAAADAAALEEGRRGRNANGRVGSKCACNTLQLCNLLP